MTNMSGLGPRREAEPGPLPYRNYLLLAGMSLVCLVGRLHVSFLFHSSLSTPDKRLGSRPFADVFVCVLSLISASPHSFSASASVHSFFGLNYTSHSFS